MGGSADDDYNREECIRLQAQVDTLEEAGQKTMDDLVACQKKLRDTELQIADFWKNAAKMVRDTADEVLDSENPGDKTAFQFAHMLQKKMRGTNDSRPEPSKCECIPGVHKNCPQHGFPPLRPLEGPGSVDE